MPQYWAFIGLAVSKSAACTSGPGCAQWQGCASVAYPSHHDGMSDSVRSERPRKATGIARSRHHSSATPLLFHSIVVQPSRATACNRVVRPANTLRLHGGRLDLLALKMPSGRFDCIAVTVAAFSKSATNGVQLHSGRSAENSAHGADAPCSAFPLELGGKLLAVSLNHQGRPQHNHYRACQRHQEPTARVCELPTLARVANTQPCPER